MRKVFAQDSYQVGMLVVVSMSILSNGAVGANPQVSLSETRKSQV